MAVLITIVTQPIDEVVVGGSEPVDLVVAATTTGAEPITYQWYQCDDLLKTNPVAIELGTTAILTFGVMNPGYSYYYFCRLSAADSDPIDTDVVTIRQDGVVPAVPSTFVTGAFVFAYLAQCSVPVQERFAALQEQRRIIIDPAGTRPLYTEELSIFMDAI